MLISVLIVVIIVAVSSGVWFYGQYKNQTKLNSSLQEKTEELSTKLEASNSISIRLEAEKEGLEKLIENERTNALEKQESLTKQLELLGRDIVNKGSKILKTENQEQLGELLLPLKERLSAFEKEVRDNNKQDIERSANLDKHLKMLQELNQEITQETRSLTQALRGDSKTQGNWGEMHLEAILEKAGLQKEIHYSKETNLKTEDGNNQRLDYIINLPDGKNLILDSKVSLTAYSNYHDTDDESEMARYLKLHIDSINGHIKLLGGKDYQKLHDINTPDYVLMFVSNEPALTLALREDQGLFEKALDKNIVIVSTSTLLATLRTISYIWKQDLQNKNAEEIARQAGNLYDKFVGFTEDLLKLGSQMDTASKTYRDAMKKMVEGSGNITKRIQDLKKLGVNPSKEIDGRLIDKADD